MQRDTMLAEDEDTELLECDEMIKGRVQNLTFGKQTKIEIGKKTSKLRVRRKEKDGKFGYLRRHLHCRNPKNRQFILLSL